MMLAIYNLIKSNLIWAFNLLISEGSNNLETLLCRVANTYTLYLLNLNSWKKEKLFKTRSDVIENILNTIDSYEVNAKCWNIENAIYLYTTTKSNK